MYPTRCFEIQEKVLGRHYDFKNEKDGAIWYKDGGLDKCPVVSPIGLPFESWITFEEFYCCFAF